MPAAAAPPAAPRRGLPGVVVGLCVLVGVVTGAYAVVTLLSIATASTEHVRRTFAAVEQLHVDVGSGDVEVIGERRRDVLVDAEVQRGMWRGAWRPTTELRRDGVRLDATSGCSFWAHIGVSDCGASFTIRVPRDTRVTVDASSGHALVTGLDGAVAIDSSSGDVHAIGLSGPVRIGSSSGDVHVERHRGAELDASAQSGDIDVEARRPPRRLDLAASSGDVHAEVPDVRYRVVVATGSGDADVGVSQDPSASRLIDVKAASGDVSVQPLPGLR